ncbi:MAG: (5-formylfuran-3-yl)methyl phosphate synthase [Aureliella sp.]
MTGDALLTADSDHRFSPAQLLVSIRNATEANAALHAGVDWIDLKEPNHGSLGLPTLETAAAVATLLCDAGARSRSSVALGELCEVMPKADEVIAAYSRRFPVAKVGLAEASPGWRENLDQLRSLVTPCQLVPVHYADFKECKGVPLPEIFDWMNRSAPVQANRRDNDVSESLDGCVPRVLIDTKLKDGRTLLDFYSVDELIKWCSDAASLGIRLLLAGSLNAAAVLQLRRTGAEAVGVRGAVCQGERNSSLCELQLRNLVEQFNSKKDVFEPQTAHR